MIYIALLQGVLYVLTGLWPLVSMGTFLKVTGPKTDLWLVKTVGVLIAVIGGVLLAAGLQGDDSTAVVMLAIGSAMGLAAVDVVFVVKRVIGPVYLLDAVAELAIVVGWIITLVV